LGRQQLVRNRGWYTYRSSCGQDEAFLTRCRHAFRSQSSWGPLHGPCGGETRRRAPPGRLVAPHQHPAGARGSHRNRRGRAHGCCR
jgi:hypothetical protein